MEQYLQLYEMYEVTDFDLVRIHVIKNNNILQNCLNDCYNAVLCSCIAFINIQKEEQNTMTVIDCMDFIHNGVCKRRINLVNSSEKLNNAYLDAVESVSHCVKKLIKKYGKERTENVYHSIVFELIELKNVDDGDLRELILPSPIKKFVKSTGDITVKNNSLSAA